MSGRGRDGEKEAVTSDVYRLLAEMARDGGWERLLEVRSRAFVLEGDDDEKPTGGLRRTSCDVLPICRCIASSDSSSCSIPVLIGSGSGIWNLDERSTARGP